MPSEKQPAPAKRGEAAWKETKDRIAARNDAARKAGKERREETERVRAEARRATAADERAAAMRINR